MHPRTFSKHVQHDSIVAAIREAEHKTSGRIRVSISPKHVDEPVVAAQVEFMRLGMDKSPERNGVLIFVAPRSHKFAVIGDEGRSCQVRRRILAEAGGHDERLFPQI